MNIRLDWQKMSGRCFYPIDMMQNGEWNFSRQHFIGLVVFFEDSFGKVLMDRFVFDSIYIWIWKRKSDCYRFLNILLSMWLLYIHLRKNAVWHIHWTIGTDYPLEFRCFPYFITLYLICLMAFIFEYTH